jgi:hypothetical protein
MRPCSTVQTLFKAGHKQRQRGSHVLGVTITAMSTPISYMSLIKRGKTWWIDFATPSGKRVRCTARTANRAQAQELHDKLKADALRQGQLSERPKHTWDDAAYKWLMETSHKATHGEDKSKLSPTSTVRRQRRRFCAAVARRQYCLFIL